ncbi:MAG: hypothetical protein HKN82_10915 [Akkermansiaceae bacterium]|nr:hypothetical protein [Akkermansiaceae bacterium]NNM28040.1 hypothetical protein [Akkermansiaceae bacterium]
MRILVAALAATMLGLAGMSPRAEAGHALPAGWSQTYACGRAKCGCPYYTTRVCCGHDRFHRPVFRYYRQPFKCKCKHRKHYKHPKKYKKYKHPKYKHKKYKHKKYKRQKRK